MTTAAIAVGVLTPHETAGAETEFPRMAPGHVRTMTSRIRSPAGVMVTPAEIHGAVRALAGPVDVLALASSSSGYAIGFDAESALVHQLQDHWGVPACTTSLSVLSALRRHGVERICLVHPPWFGRPLHQRGAQYFHRQGYEVVDAHLAGLPHDPDDIEPPRVVEWVARHVSDRAEAVVLGGNGLRAAGAIQDLEARLGRPVLQANQVLLWSVLRSAQLPADIHGFGSLFDDQRRSTS